MKRPLKKQEKQIFYDLGEKELSDFLVQIGEPEFRKSQIWEGVYRHLWEDPSSFYNIPQKTRDSLMQNFSFSSLETVMTQKSSDGQTEKTLFKLQDSSHIETVLMGYENRQTLCISSQSGCPIGCVFCATGQMGFFRNLSTGELIEQVLILSRKLKMVPSHLTNIVVMGMGEPFLNYENTLKSINILNQSNGFKMGERRFTISTVGIIPGIERFTSEKRQINLAVSLHAPNDGLRSTLVPINKKYSLGNLMIACRDYVEHTGRRITFEYALIEGINDSPGMAKDLVSLVKGLLCHINLIQLNSSPIYDHKPSNLNNSKKFIQVLEAAGIPATLRLRRGLDINAGCGQLAYFPEQSAPR
jgi:23S rRNA (adenine2503-C2)-methyltransferase